LIAGAAAAVALPLSACAASPSGGGSASASTSTPTPSGSTPDGQTSAPNSTSDLVKTSAVPVQGSVVVSGPDNQPVVVAQPHSGHFVAFSAICTHMGCTVAPAGRQLQCPCHGSIYNAFTGAVISGLAPSPLPKVKVKVSNGEVVAT
jgi:Rieske Fe-S protein